MEGHRRSGSESVQEEAQEAAPLHSWSCCEPARAWAVASGGGCSDVLDCRGVVCWAKGVHPRVPLRVVHDRPGFRGCRRCRRSRDVGADVAVVVGVAKPILKICLAALATSATSAYPRHRRKGAVRISRHRRNVADVVDTASLRRSVGADVTEPMSRRCCADVVDVGEFGCGLIGISSRKHQ